MKRRASFAIALLLVGSLLAVGCGGSQTAATNNTPAGSSAPATGGKPFKIGVVTSLSGNYEFLGKTTEAGVQAAVKILNDKGGVKGGKVESITCNDETNPQTARSCYEKLVKKDKVDVLVGFPLGAATDAVAPDVAADKIVTWVLGGAYGGRDMNGQKYMFSGLPVTEDVLTATFEWASSKGYKKAWILTTEDETGKPCREFAAKDDATRKGIQVIGTNTMQATAQSAAPQVAQIDRTSDFVFLCVSGGGGVVAAKAYEQAGLTMPSVAVHSQGVPFIAKAMQGGVTDDKLRVASFCTLGVITGELKAEYKCVASAQEYVTTAKQVAPTVEPDVLGAHAYDGAILLASAAKETDGSADAMVAWLEKQTSFPAAMGIYSFNGKQHRGITSDQILLGIYRGGTWHLDNPLKLPKS